MRVEAPTTMMQAYQQGRANRRQDRLDEQKLAFDVFDESRARKKHELQMDTGIENLRNKKTMNPLMESLALYKNKLAYGTLDADIAENAEITDNLIKMNDIKQATQLSDLDNLQMKRNQRDYLSQTGSIYDTGVSSGEEEKRALNRGLTYDLVGKGLTSGIQDLDIDIALNQPNLTMAIDQAEEFATQKKELPGRYQDMIMQSVANKYEYPISLAYDQNTLSGKGFDQAFRLYDLKDKDLQEMEGNIEGYRKEQARVKDLLQDPKGNKDEINDAMNTLKIYRELFGFGQGGLLNMQQGGK